MPELTQRRLVLELRLAIDAVRSRPNPPPVALERVAKIVSGNPQGIRSTHVQYNIGSARRKWLDSYLQDAGAISPRSTTR